MSSRPRRARLPRQSAPSGGSWTNWLGCRSSWPTLPMEGAQAIAVAVSAAVGGIFADPERRGKLFIRVAKQRKGEVLRLIATSERVFGK